MARDAVGAEWGRYFRDKRKLGPVATLRAQKIPCIYLLYRVRSDLKWFGSFQHEVKIGMTARSPQLRADSLRSDGYSLYAYWGLHNGELEQAEKDVIKAMRQTFSDPSRGREFFIVTRVDTAYRLVVDTLAENGVRWDYSEY